MRLCAVLLAVLAAGAAGGKQSKNVGKLRSAGDLAFSKGDAKKAEQFFSKVIKLEPKNERNYFKRYRAALRQRKYNEGLADLRKAVGLDPKYKAGWEHRANLELMLGHCEDAEGSYGKLLELKPGHGKGRAGLSTAQQCAQHLRTARQLGERQQHGAAHDHITSALELEGATHKLLHTSHRLLLERAEVNLRREQYYEVLADSGRALKLQQDSMAALLVRGDAYYRLAEHDMAMRHYRQGLHFDPEHKACKTAYRRLKKLTKLAKKADAAAEGGRHEEAVGLYAEARAVDGGHKEFVKGALLKGAQSLIALQKLEEAKGLAQQALAIDPTLADAHVVAGKAHMAAEEWQDAVRAFKAAAEQNKEDGTIREELKKAEAALKQSKEKNYYKILGIARDATDRQIKSAYRKLAIKWHPDKHAGGTKEQQKAAEKMFQDIGEAHEVLSKPELKAKYDRGEDVFENQGGGGQRGGPHMFHHGGQHFHMNFGF